MLIVFVNCYENGFLTFEKYSKRIYDFTSKAHDGSNVILVAGDMDFFGGIKTVETEHLFLMEESKEYNQLLQLADKIKLKILCNNKLEEKLFNAIMADTISPKVFYNKYRTGGNLGSSSFQQLLRIGKIKSDFGRSVEIRFYSSDDDDTRFRGRFIDNEGLLYRKEREKVKYNYWQLIKIFIRSPFKVKEYMQAIQQKEDLYSIEYLNDQKYIHYYDMFKMKWNLYDFFK